MNGYIYIIRNKINSKVYIGQTTQRPKDRWKDHKSKSKYKNNVLYKAIRKYGIDNFYMNIIEDNVPYEKLSEREIFWIEKYDSYKNGYNMTIGGEGNGRLEVYKIHIVTNEILETYGSITSAAKINDLDISQLSKVCRKQAYSLGGYKWCYVDDYDYDYLKSLDIRSKSRKIYQINSFTGVIIKTWNKEEDICNELGLNQPSLSKCLNGGNKTAGGYCWSYVDAYHNFIPRTSTKNIYQLSKDEESVIRLWKSAKEIENNLGFDASNIRACCRGKQKTAFGYKWRYKDE